MFAKVERIKNEETSWLKLLVTYGFNNKPFILENWSTKNWKARKHWINENETPNLDFFNKNYGESIVPILKEDNYEQIKLKDYLSKIEENQESDSYLKDWHFQNIYGTSFYEPLHPFFSRDFINCEKWTKNKEMENPFNDDYRFVYFGKAGTWTKFHSDVASTHSWSANICGRKLWFLMPPGMETFFKTTSGFVEDIRQFEYLFEKAQVIKFVQEPGEIVFIPSNWYHQVHNLTDTISINHNWINSTNICYVKQFLNSREVDVRNELNDCKPLFDSNEFEEKVELVLFADARLNQSKFKKLCELVRKSRKNTWKCQKHGKNLFQCANDEFCQQNILKICNCSTSFCENCLEFIESLEYSIVSTFL